MVGTISGWSLHLAGATVPIGVRFLHYGATVETARTGMNI